MQALIFVRSQQLNLRVCSPAMRVLQDIVTDKESANNLSSASSGSGSERDILRDPTKRKSEFRTLILLGLAFLLHFTAFNSAHQIVTKIYEQLGYANLGRYCIITIYAFLAISNFIFPTIVKRIGLRNSFFFSSFGYLLTFLSGIQACSCFELENPNSHFFCSHTMIYAANIISSAICGFCASVLWGAQARYMAEIINPIRAGRYVGTFSAIVNSSVFTGNLLSTIIFSFTNQKWFYIILFTIDCVAVFCFRLLPDVKISEKSPPIFGSAHADPSTSFEVVDAHTDPSAPSPEEDQSFTRQLRKILSVPQDKRIRIWLLNGFFAGLCPTFYIGMLYKVVDHSAGVLLSKEEEDRRVAFILMTLGGIQCAVGLIYGRILDRINKIRGAHTALLVIQGALIITMLAYYLKDYKLCAIAAILWGLGEGMLGLTNGFVTAKEFQGQLEVIAMMMMCGVSGTVVGFVAQLPFSGKDPMGYFMFIVAFHVFISTALGYFAPDAKLELEEREVKLRRHSLDERGEDLGVELPKTTSNKDEFNQFEPHYRGSSSGGIQ
eukprot:TRINITY_DN11504_c0_g1_i1.p1 TRINITY_DN11504_c0_g1~~TRINITY_DN11504_c0_g1_i1.p1  ORF type:complete len:550 (-),score=120.58 TRINITY_DN11504_c0_g1_i1:168-1817(-)